MTVAVQAPTVDQASSGCSDAQTRKLRHGYQIAAGLARGAVHYTTDLETRCTRGQGLAWASGPAPRFFGDYAAAKVQTIAKVFAGVDRRFTEGFAHPTQITTPRIECFSPDYGRCQQGLLANASIFGTIRVCPRLLKRSTQQVAQVLLHEMLHQGLGVGDRRHSSCGSSKDRRCYREGAERLVESGRTDLALQNNDNYVGFAVALAGARGRTVT